MVPFEGTVCLYSLLHYHFFREGLFLELSSKQGIFPGTSAREAKSHVGDRGLDDNKNQGMNLVLCWRNNEEGRKFQKRHFP